MQECKQFESKEKTANKAIKLLTSLASTAPPNLSFINLLFADDDLLYTGEDKKGTVTKRSEINPNAPFFTVNALDSIDHKPSKPWHKAHIPRRSNLNSKLRNFIFESDSAPLAVQIERTKQLQLEPSTITYSGGKSLHIIYALTECISKPHTDLGVKAYKQAYKLLKERLQDQMQLKLDPSCINPSRLTRMPGAFRPIKNGTQEQFGLHLGRLYARDELFGDEDFDEQVGTHTDFSKLTTTCTDRKSFIRAMSPGLFNVLRYPSWAASENMYPLLLRYTLWALDETGVDFNTLISFLNERTFPALISKGYPREKLIRPIEEAYVTKGLRVSKEV